MGPSGPGVSRGPPMGRPKPRAGVQLTNESGQPLTEQEVLTALNDPDKKQQLLAKVRETSPELAKMAEEDPAGFAKNITGSGGAMIPEPSRSIGSSAELTQETKDAMTKEVSFVSLTFIIGHGRNWMR